MVGVFTFLPKPFLNEFQFRGGMKASGIGRENGLEALEACGFLLDPVYVPAAD
jgi:hypothetical protein